MSHVLPTISALGTSWWIEIFDTLPPERYTVIHDDCVAFLRTFENRYSRFKPDSLLGMLNATGTHENRDETLQTLLTFGIDQHARTDGLFNLMVGETLIKTGYDSTYSFTAEPALKRIPHPQQAITITPELITLHEGAIDFGGFGKGYAIDCIADILRTTYGLQYFLVNGGGDMFGTSDHDAAIQVYLEHPTEPNAYIETTTLKDQGFAASSPHKRSWKSGDRTYTHIISTEGATPENARPDATFIKAATAVTADIFATVALLSSPSQMEKFASNEQLGVASFYLRDNTLIRNVAFEQSAHF